MQPPGESSSAAIYPNGHTPHPPNRVAGVASPPIPRGAGGRGGGRGSPTRVADRARCRLVGADRGRVAPCTDCLTPTPLAGDLPDAARRGAWASPKGRRDFAPKRRRDSALRRAFHARGDAESRQRGALSAACQRLQHGLSEGGHGEVGGHAPSPFLTRVV